MKLPQMPSKLTFSKKAAPTNTGYVEEISVKKRKKEEEIPTWWTPWSWLTDQGVYYGSNGAWLYRELPPDVLSTGGLKPLLEGMLATIGEREIHLTSHAWSAPVDEQTLPTTGTDLDNYLRNALTLHTPTWRLLIGIKLSDKDENGKKILPKNRGISAEIDKWLGEDVPDLDVFQPDADRVERALKGFNASPPSKDARDHLESWYTQGVVKDVDVTEMDTHIDIGGTSMLIAATSRPDYNTRVLTRGTPAPVVGAVLCFSLRTVIVEDNKKPGNVLLSVPSIVLARRAPITTPWLEELEIALPKARRAGLPLRQLPALDETLPCSQQRTNPLAEPLTTEALTHAGFTDHRPAGDNVGLLVGMAGMHYTDIAMWNPLRASGQMLHIVGEPKSGKTFLAEHLSVQAHLAGMTVRYLSADAESGKALVDLGVKGWADPHGGMFDPGPLPGVFSQWWKLTLTALAAASPAVPVEAYEQVLERNITRPTLPSLADIPKAMYDPRAGAEAIKLAKKQNSLAWACSGGRGGVPRGSGSWSMPHLLQNFMTEYGEKNVAADMLIANAILSRDNANEAMLVVVDGAKLGPLSYAALAAARQSGLAVTVIVTYTSTPTVKMGVDDCAILLALNETNAPLTYSWAQIDEKDPMLQFCAPQPSLYDLSDTVQAAATGMMRDHTGRVSPLVIAPVAVKMLPSLARNLDAHYPKRG